MPHYGCRIRNAAPSHILLTYLLQPDEHEIVVSLHFMPTVACHCRREPARNDNRQFAPYLRKESVYHAVDRCGGAENSTRAHAVDGIFADSGCGRGERDVRQLCRAVGERSAPGSIATP